MERRSLCLLNQHLQLIPIIQMEDFQKLLVRGPFELFHLSETKGHFHGDGFDIILEADQLQVKNMNSNELSFNFNHLISFEIRKSKVNGK